MQAYKEIQRTEHPESLKEKDKIVDNWFFFSENETVITFGNIG